MKKILIAASLAIASCSPAYAIFNIEQMSDAGVELMEQHLASGNTNKTKNDDGSYIFQCDVSVYFPDIKHTGSQVIHTTTGDEGYFEFSDKANSTWIYTVSADSGMDGMQLMVDTKTNNATVVMYDENGNDVGRGDGVCFGGRG